MKSEKIKWGVIGPGRIATKFTTSLEHVKDAELHAIGSRSLDKATAFAKATAVKKAYGSYEEMLQDEEIDVVYVATPHVFHHEHTLLCLNHGKAVLCEKPFALNREQVEEMVKTAKAKEVFLMEAMWTPFLPHIQHIKSLITSGMYGNIKKLEADFGFYSPFNAEGRLFKKSLGGGSLLDIGIYPVFLALHTLGMPLKVEAKAKMSKTGIDEDCDIVFTYPDMVVAQLKSSIIEDTPTAAKIVLENATIEIHSRWHEPTTVSVTTSKGTESKSFEAASYGYEYEAMHVHEMLRKGRTESDVMTFSKSLELISLLDQIRKEIDLEY